VIDADCSRSAMVVKSALELTDLVGRARIHPVAEVAAGEGGRSYPRRRSRCTIRASSAHEADANRQGQQQQDHPDWSSGPAPATEAIVAG